MSPGEHPVLRRRRLPALLGVGALGVLSAGCSSRTTTNTSVPRDPLAEHADLYNASTADDLVDLELQDDPDTASAWDGVDPDSEQVRNARRELADFIEICFLSPEELGGLDTEQRKERVVDRAPEIWHGELDTVFSGDRPHLNIVTFAEGLRMIGKPLVAADWFRADIEGDPGVRLGGTIVSAVLNPETNATGMCAHRIGTAVRFDDSGAIDKGGLFVSINGVNLCETENDDGRIHPVMSDATGNDDLRRRLMEEIVSAPRISLQDLIAESPTVFQGNNAPNISSC